MRTDFGSVRVHDGSAADASARGVAADAYTVGSDIVFASGRYAPQTHEGRALLAHELVHVIQQRGTTPPAAGQDLPIAPGTSDYEVDARHAAQRVGRDADVSASAGAVVSRRAPRAMIMRQPAPAHAAEQSKKETITIQVPVDEDLSTDEFRIRAIMQLFDIGHDAAVREIKDHGWTFHGEHDPARHGLIPFVVRLDPESVKRSELVEARRQQAVSALSSPKMNAMMSISPPGRVDATHALGPGEAEALLQAAQIVDRMDLEDLERYNRILGKRAGNWQDFLSSVTQFENDQLTYRRAKGALSGDRDLLNLITARNELAATSASAPWLVFSLREAQSRLDEALKKRGFDSQAQYEEQVAAPWRDVFEARALELANAALDSAVVNARAARATLADPSQAETMWLALQALKLGGVDIEQRQDLLTAYPILRSTKARRYAMRFDDPKDFSWWMGSFALQMQVGCMNVKDVLRRQPERVFGLDAVVGATLSEMGLTADSPQAQALALGLGDRADHSFWSGLLAVVDFLQYFIPGWGELRAIGNFLNESYEYELGKVEATAGLRSSDPSAAGVIVSGIGAALPFVAPAAPAAIGKVARLGGRFGRWGLASARDLTVAARFKFAEPILRGADLGFGDLGRIRSSSLVEPMAEAPAFSSGIGELTPDLPGATPDVAPTPSAPTATGEAASTPSAPAASTEVADTTGAPLPSAEASEVPLVAPEQTVTGPEIWDELAHEVGTTPATQQAGWTITGTWRTAKGIAYRFIFGTRTLPGVNRIGQIRMTLGHIVEKSTGGAHALDNLMPQLNSVNVRLSGIYGRKPFALPLPDGTWHVISEINGKPITGSLREAFEAGQFSIEEQRAISYWITGTVITPQLEAELKSLIQQIPGLANLVP